MKATTDPEVEIYSVAWKCLVRVCSTTSKEIHEHSLIKPKIELHRSTDGIVSQQAECCAHPSPVRRVPLDLGGAAAGGEAGSDHQSEVGGSIQVATRRPAGRTAANTAGKTRETLNCVRF